MTTPSSRTYVLNVRSSTCTALLRLGVLLVGCPGVGKTSLLRELSRASALYFMQSHNKGNVTNSLVVVVDKDDEICGGGHGVGVHASVKPAIR